MSWHGDPPLDVTLVAHEGVYIASSTETVAETAALEAFVVVGTLYEIRINSYYDYQEFDLLARLVPNARALSQQPGVLAGSKTAW